jgi:phosphoribosylformimino-5-aminoimidazole carboxamide ribonucleotide (ProFAR) isomerase
MCPHDVIISGGVTTLADLTALEDIGGLGHRGLALYMGTIRPEDVWGAGK